MSLFWSIVIGIILGLLTFLIKNTIWRSFYESLEKSWQGRFEK